MHLLVVKNRYLVVFVLPVFVVVIWVLRLKKALVLKVKHGLLRSWHMAEQLVSDVWRLDEWTHQFKDLLLDLAFGEALVHQQNARLSQGLLLVENVVAAFGLHDDKLNWAQIVDFLAFVHLAFYGNEVVLFI